MGQGTPSAEATSLDVERGVALSVTRCDARSRRTASECATMRIVPVDTHYAESGDLSIAYQVWGDGPRDLVVTPGVISHVEFFHEIPGYTAWLERLSRFARVIVFDKRGNGLSDRPEAVGTLEERIDDMRSVMDAVGCGRAVVVGWSEGAAMSVLYAATYPDRVTHLVLSGGYACYVGEPDEGAVMSQEGFESTLAGIVEHWGEGEFLKLIGPSLASEPAADRLLGRVERHSATPRTIGRLYEAFGKIDVRPLLPAIRVPTLVVRRANEAIPDHACRYLADRIPGAAYSVLPGDDHLPWVDDYEAYVAVVEEFVTGTPVTATRDDRVLATVLFTDIVGSTERAASMGDRRWRELLDRFQAVVRREIDRYRGHEVNTRGDDFLITFDGPARAIRCATAITSAAENIGLSVRCGIHTGEIELRGDDIAGMAVHIGARVSGLAQAGEILATTTVRDLVVGSGIGFRDRATHELKGVPGRWSLVAVAD
jgi:pimeloyl-ACP methyl ester carboxylesterase